jgi:hypothetical protein
MGEYRARGSYEFLTTDRSALSHTQTILSSVLTGSFALLNKNTTEGQKAA